MKLLKQRYFPNLFVAIMVENNDTFLLARIIKNGVVKKSYEATFENQEYLKALNHSVVDYLVARQTDVLDTYMAVFANSKSQGLVPTLDLVELEKYGINPSHIKQISLTKDAMVYVPYSEINITREYFKQTGIDLLYSPFAILHNMLKRDGFPSKVTLFLYNHHDNFTISIYKNEEILFGVHVKTAEDQVDLEKEAFSADDIEFMKEEKGVENLVHLDSDDEEVEFSSLDDIESLDNIDGSGEIFDEGIIIPQDGNMIARADSAQSVDLLGRSMKVYELLKKIIAEFYSNQLYKSEFIEEIYIYDNYKISRAISDMLESELMIGVKYKNVNTLEEMLNMAIEDLEL